MKHPTLHTKYHRRSGQECRGLACSLAAVSAGMAWGSQKLWQSHELERIEIIASLASVLETVLQSSAIPIGT